MIYWKAPAAIRDINKALTLLQSCCKSELPEGYASLAKFLMTEGKDMPAARALSVMELLTQGAERGSIEACFLLGREYSTGERCPIDNLLAYKYLFMASKLGHTESKKFVHLLEGIKDKVSFSGAMQDALDTISEMESRMVRFV
jgi:TPR repeat protein